LAPERTAFFLDVDGTLAEIVPDPQQARVEPSVLAVLERLSERAQYALALISGRSIEQIDRMLAPLRLPAVGVHGLERRLHDGEMSRYAYDEQAHAELVAAVEGFAADHDGLEADPKPGAVALHYRKQPDLEDQCRQFMQDRADADPQLSLMSGKMVLELIYGRQTKGEAVASLMESSPYAGRVPFFAGDDVTDEKAFAQVNLMDGISVKVGEGATKARYRVPDLAALVRYLDLSSQDRSNIREPISGLDVS
jgi:trehalose 6-phosphate phosphatase